MSANAEVLLVLKARNETQAALQAVKGDLAALGGAANSMKQTLASAAATMRNVGLGLTATITAPVVALGASALSSAGDFQQAMNVMQQVTGATGDTMAQMQATALQLGRDTSFSAGDAAQAMLELGKAGMGTADILASVPGVLTLAAAGGLELASAAELTANSLNAFNLPAADAAAVANLLAAAANASSVEVKDLAEASRMASAVFAINGQSIEDMTTALALMGNNALKGSDAGTSLKQMMMSLTAPTDKARGILADFGIEVYDAQGTILPFATILRDLNAAFTGVDDATRNAAMSTIFGSDAIRAASILVKNAGPEWDAMAASVTKAGAAQAVADARMQGLSGAVEYFKGTIESTLIEAVLPFMAGIASAMRQAADFVAGFSRLAPEVRNVIVVVAAAAAAVGPLLVGLGMLTSAVGAALPVLGAVGGVLAALASPIGLVVVGIGTLGAAFATDFMGMRTAATQTFAPIIAGFQRVRQAFATGMVTVKGVLKELGSTLLGLGADSATAEISLQELATIFTGSATAGAQFQSALESIGAVLTPMRLAVAGVLVAFQTFGASGTWSNLVATVTGSLRAIGSAIAGVFGGKLSLPDLAGKIGQQFNNIAAAVRDAVASAGFGDLRASLVGAIGLDKIDFGQLRESLAAFVGNIASTITAFDWGGALASAGSWLGGLTSWAVTSLTGIDWGTALATAGAWLGGLTAWVTDKITAIDWGTALATATEWLSGFTSWAVTEITTIDWGTALATATEWLSGLISWIIDGITNIDWATELATAAMKWLGGLTSWAVGEITTIDWGTVLATATEWLSGLTAWAVTEITTIDWGTGLATAGEWLGGLTSWAVGEITSIDWGLALATAGEWLGGFTAWVKDEITTIDWGTALATAGGMADSLRDAVLKHLKTALTDLNLTDSFTGMIDSVTAAIDGIKWGDIGKNAAKSLKDTVKGSFEQEMSDPGYLLPAATSSFALLNIPLAAALIGVKWVFTSDQFSGFRDAAVGAITSIDWGAIAESFATLKTKIQSAFFELGFGFGKEIATFDWSEFITPLSDWGTYIKEVTWSTFITPLGVWTQWVKTLTWSDFVDELGEWSQWVKTLTWSSFIDALGEWTQWVKALTWSDFVQALASWAAWIKALTWSDFVPVLTWPVIPDFNWGDWINPWSWPIFGGGSDPGTPGGQLGKSYFSGGWSWVGEAGPELVHLPRGTEIVNNRQSMALAAESSRPTVNIYGGMSVRDDRDIYSIAYQVADLLARG